jgi:hypothetical protein
MSGPAATLAELVRLLAELCQQGAPVNLRLEFGSWQGMVSCRPGCQPAGQAGKPFSPIEEAILASATRDWQTAQQFADLTGQKCNHWFYAIIGNLADREYLESGRSGYRLPTQAKEHEA